MEKFNVTVDSDWKDLNYAVLEMKQDNPEMPIWQQLRELPITPQSIQTLFNNGWELTSLATMRSGECRYGEDSSHGTIYIGYFLSPFMRDIILCHEIVHAHYKSPNQDLRDSFCKLGIIENELITDWQSRKIRANPRILRSIAKQFDGIRFPFDYIYRPVIYDRTTFLAFGLHNYDIDQAMRKCPKPLKSLPILMSPSEDPTFPPTPYEGENEFKYYEDLLI